MQVALALHWNSAFDRGRPRSVGSTSHSRIQVSYWVLTQSRYAPLVMLATHS